MMKAEKRVAAALSAALLALVSVPGALADGGTITVNEDISVSEDYDWTRFADDNITLNVYNWGLYPTTAWMYSRPL